MDIEDTFKFSELYFPLSLITKNQLTHTQ